MYTVTDVTQNINYDDNNDDGDYDSNTDNEYIVLEPVLTFQESILRPHMMDLVLQDRCGDRSICRELPPSRCADRELACRSNYCGEITDQARG